MTRRYLVWLQQTTLGEESSSENDESNEDNEEEDENIDVGLMDNVKTAGGALLLLCLFLRLLKVTKLCKTKTKLCIVLAPTSLASTKTLHFSTLSTFVSSQ